MKKAMTIMEEGHKERGARETAVTMPTAALVVTNADDGGDDDSDDNNNSDNSNDDNSCPRASLATTSRSGRPLRPSTRSRPSRTPG